MNEEILKSIVLPRHIGIIMDGNGRWATRQGLERTEGHKAGAETFRTICTYASDIGLEAITFYAFSTENWKRPEAEVNAIMNLLRDFLLEALERNSENSRCGFQIHFIGDRSALPEDIAEQMEQCEKDTEGKNRTIVNIAVNYGGRAEVANAARLAAEKVLAGELKPEDISPDVISSLLYTAGQPEPDLIIRPGGESRVSNFLIWQSAYAEFYFTDILWPDFTTEDLDNAILSFCKRNRRFGGV